MDQDVFDAFVRQQQPLQIRDDLDGAGDRDGVDRELAEWLDQLNFLYDLVQLYLEAYVRASQVKVELGITKLFEEQTGAYDAPNMLVRVGKTLIQFEPIGTFLIGAKGRVNVSGAAGNAVLLLVPKGADGIGSMVGVSSSTTPSGLNVSVKIGYEQEEASISWVWKLVANTPKREFLELSAETVYQMLVELSPARVRPDTPKAISD